MCGTKSLLSEQDLTIALVAGELSGDNLGAPLIHAIKQVYPKAKFVGIGGPQMIAAGLESWTDIEDLSVNGFVDPIRRLPSLLRILLGTRDRITQIAPDCFIGIDFNFFNGLLEGMVKKRGIKTVHYVSPSVWAWRRGRIKSLRRNLDLMLTLYPFETQIYRDNGINVEFVGHPKADEISEVQRIDAKAEARKKLDLRFEASDPGAAGYRDVARKQRQRSQIVRARFLNGCANNF